MNYKLSTIKQIREYIKLQSLSTIRVKILNIQCLNKYPTNSNISKFFGTNYTLQRLYEQEDYLKHSI